MTASPVIFQAKHNGAPSRAPSFEGKALTRKTKLLLASAGMAVAAFVSVLVAVYLANHTVVPMASTGATVTNSGWLALVTSVLSSAGFSLGGVVTFAMSLLHFPTSLNGKQTGPEILELIEAFAALMRDRASRAAQRRFFFALVDSVGFIQGCQTNHENGIVTISYHGYADSVEKSQ